MFVTFNFFCVLLLSLIKGNLVHQPQNFKILADF
uniref:Uncharacterized protein n=1 Tax=Anguilla anguilla TaxID=7936 RepID=A0A0E9R9G6_ANGAN